MPQLTSAPVSDARLRDREQPTLVLDTLTLRPWRLSDAPAVAEAYADPEIRRWHARSMDELEAQEWIASWTSRWTAETGAGWAVTCDDVVVGRTSFGIDLDVGCAEAAYWTVPAARGLGIAARALRTASLWMLTSGGLHRLELNHAAANLGSCGVARKVGFAYEGTRRRQGLHEDGWHDMHMHGLLIDDLTPEP